MDRLFSAFPNKSAGLGLLWLRIAMLLALLSSNASPLMIRVALACAGMFIVAGLLTPIVCGVIAVLAVVSAGWLLVTGTPLLFDNLCVHGLVTAIAGALVMIGPGAYSIDARLFGWRELRVPEP